MQKAQPKTAIFKPQKQTAPGLESKMEPRPEFDPVVPSAQRLAGKQCIITGGDSGIGRAVAVAFANEGAEVAIIYLKSEQADAEETARRILEMGNKKAILVPADLSKESNCVKAIEKILKTFGGVDVLVNNAAVHFPQKDIRGITKHQLNYTFAVNIFSMFWLTQACLPHMGSKSSILNTTSVTAYRGSGGLLDYSATKGAIVAFTRSLSANLIEKGIRVNGVAPGPIWTPLVPSSFDPDKVSTYGTDTPMHRPGQPSEVAPAYVFLASEEASYISGQIIHVNGGEIING